MDHFLNSCERSKGKEKGRNAKGKKSLRLKIAFLRTSPTDEFRIILFAHLTPFSTTDFVYVSIRRPDVNSSTGPNDLVIAVNKMALNGQSRMRNSSL